MRRFIIQYRRGAGSQFRTLTPVVHRSIYDRQEIHTAVTLLQTVSFITAIAIQAGDEQFNVMAVPAEHQGAHVFEENQTQIQTAPVSTLNLDDSITTLSPEVNQS